MFGYIILVSVAAEVFVTAEGAQIAGSGYATSVHVVAGY